MKKFITIILISLFLGSLMAYFFYKDINSEVKAITKKEEIITLFQVGVFKDYKNALNFANTFPSNYIYKDNEYYRVVVGLTYHEEAKVKVESLLLESDINYYLKEVRVNKDLIDKLSNYETILLKTTKKEVIYNVLNSMLDIYSGYTK